MSLTANPIKVVAIRERQGLTQEQLAHIAGYSDRTIRRVEAGSPVMPQVLFDIATALEVCVDEILSEEGESRVGRASVVVVKRLLEALVAQDSSAVHSTLCQEVVLHYMGPRILPFAGWFEGKLRVEQAWYARMQYLKTNCLAPHPSYRSVGSIVVATGTEHITLRANRQQSVLPFCLIAEVQDLQICSLKYYADHTELIRTDPFKDHHHGMVDGKPGFNGG